MGHPGIVVVVTGACAVGVVSPPRTVKFEIKIESTARRCPRPWAKTHKALLASRGASSRDLASDSSVDRETHCAIPNFLILTEHLLPMY